MNFGIWWFIFKLFAEKVILLLVKKTKLTELNKARDLLIEKDALKNNKILRISVSISTPVPPTEQNKINFFSKAI